MPLFCQYQTTYLPGWNCSSWNAYISKGIKSCKKWVQLFPVSKWYRRENRGVETEDERWSRNFCLQSLKDLLPCTLGHFHSFTVGLEVGALSKWPPEWPKLTAQSGQTSSSYKRYQGLSCCVQYGLPERLCTNKTEEILEVWGDNCGFTHSRQVTMLRDLPSLFPFHIHPSL